MKRNYRLFLCILLSMPVLLLSGCDLPSRLNFGKTSGSGESISKSGFYFNTVITVTLYGTKDETLLDDCFSLAMCQKSMQQAVHLSPCMKRPQN